MDDSRFTYRVAGRRTAILLLLATILALPTGGFAQGQRVGAWVDVILAVTEPNDVAAISRLEANDIQVYFRGLSNPQVRDRIARNRALTFATSYGLYTELTFNPVGPVFPRGSERFNPFSNPKIREAMNWLIDRRHIAEEIMGGMARPRFLPISTAFPEAARVAEVVRKLEVRYAPNPERAKAVIAEEMGNMGATLAGGKWQYQGRPVTLTFLIRNEDERRPIGDYISGLLEGVGFTVDRRYGRSGELGPTWQRGDPALGQWHLYTGGWLSTIVARDDADNFEAFYTNRGFGGGSPLWLAYKPAPAFDRLADRLSRRQFSNMAERTRLFGQALELAMQDSVRVWLVDRISVNPRRAEVKVVADLSAGYGAAELWPYTLRYEGRIGGTVKIALSNLLADPWNPIDGSNWEFDQAVIQATQDPVTINDPYTGLQHRQRVERAEVFVQRGLPVGNEVDWVSLKVVPEIRVPDDAIISWDAKAQRFITVREKHPQGLKSKTKSVIYFERDMFRKMQWHDGSRLSMGDIMMKWVLTFDRSMEASAIFDPSTVPAFESFVANFRGFRVVSEDPLVVEYYTDSFLLDADWIASGAAVAFSPADVGQGPGAWHNLAIGVRAEAAKQAAFSASKATKEKVEWVSYVAGPTLAILDRQLEAARSENFIPYAPTLGKWIKPEEARQRWTFLAHWRQGRGHYWIGLGPFQVQRVSPVEKIVELRRFPRFGDPSTKWLRFDEPRIASVVAKGPSSVRVGAEAAFDVPVTFKGRPYPAKDIKEVKYLVIDAKGEVVTSGQAQKSGDNWKVVLPASVTQRLTPGSARLEVVVVSRVVGMPTFATASFTVLPK
jgi:peptide/nickel transport system substrate-binding protein